MYLSELFDYKNLLMKEICSSQAVASLITDNPDQTVPAKDLIYSQVFPYEFIPETVDMGQTFICFDVDVAKTLERPYYLLYLYVWVFTHKSKMRLEKGGVRVDEIVNELDKILEGHKCFGLGDLKLHSVERFTPITDYQGRVLTYTAVDINKLNNDKAHAKQIPKNRRQGA